MGRLQYAVLNQPSLLDYRSDTGNHPPNTGAGIPSTTRTRPAMLSLVMFCRRRRHRAATAHSVQLWLETQRYWVRLPVGSDVCHRGCAHTVFQTVQRPELKTTIVVISRIIFNNPISIFPSDPSCHCRLVSRLTCEQSIKAYLSRHVIHLFLLFFLNLKLEFA